ncbi:MAG: FaeA/PapI family transcriptional regulator, partial [Aeromonas hydrophila]
MTTAKQQRTDCMRRDIVAFLATCPAPATTAEVGKALNISVYTARYQLRCLALAGVVQELNRGKGAKIRWTVCRD